MKQKHYIIKENECFVIYKVDRQLAPAFEEQQKENIVVSAPDLKELIIQFDRHTHEKLELKKRVRTVLCQQEHKAKVQKQKLNKQTGGL